MKSLKITVLACLFLTCVFCYALAQDYDRLDTYNQASGNFQWVSSLGDEVIHIQKMGDAGQYMIAVYADDGDGVIDKNGKEILPCEYKSVGYHGGDYMAAATTHDYKLFDLKGKEAASFNRISFPYAYAGDRYFIKYGDDHIEHWQDGIQIIDAISGETVAAYDDCYNAVRLDDGNWYISRSPDVSGAAMRWILFESYGPMTGDPQEGEAEAPEGFFVNARFEEMFDGKEYRLICQGDGLYVASVVEKSSAEHSYNIAESGLGISEGVAQRSIVVLDETGELFPVTDEAALKQIKTYENNGDMVNDARTVFKGEDGLIGFAPIDQSNDIVYVDEKGHRNTEKETPGYVVDAKYGSNKGLKLFSKIKEDDGFEMTLYGIKDPSGSVIIPPMFEEILFLPDTENILVNSDVGCGIIRLEVEP